MSFIQDLRNPHDFFASVQLIIFIAFMFGMTPVRIVGNITHRSMYLSKAGYFVTFLHMGLFATTFILALVEGTSIVGYFFKSAVAEISDNFQKAISLFGINFMYKSFFTKRQGLITLCNSLNSVDEKFIDLGITFGYKRTAYIANLELLCVLFLNVTFIIMANYIILLPNNISPPFSVSYSFFALPICISIVVVMFSVFALRLQERFSILGKVWLLRMLGKFLNTKFFLFSGLEESGSSMRW